MTRSAGASRARARRVHAGVLALFLGAVPAAGWAQGLGLERYGPRLGVSLDPDQITLGVYADLGELAADVHLRPSADLGLGDDVRTLLFNAEVVYHFAPVGTDAIPYAGGGLAFAHYKYDLPKIPGQSIDETETEVGINLLGGAQWKLRGYMSAFAELRLGIDDVPDVKLTAGLGFE